jgi:hypothetical protein
MGDVMVELFGAKRAVGWIQQVQSIHLIEIGAIVTEFGR